MAIRTDTVSRDRERSVRSFVVRGGRITDSQTRALETLWPDYGVDFQPVCLDLDKVFGRQAPRVVEIGFGNGAHLLALATAHQHIDYLGIEVHRPGVGRLLRLAQAASLRNLKVICHDAVEVFESKLAPHALDEVLILFPDPWHKKRHHKRRLIQAPFVALLASRLRSRGVLRLATDWGPYAEQMLEVLGACPTLENIGAGSGFAAPATDRAPTRFETRGARLGHGVWELRFRKRDGAP